MTDDAADLLAETFRRDWGRVVATLIGALGDWDLAEESASEAFAAALPAWRRDGLPDSPRAWLTTTARNRAIDRIRRARTGAAKLRELAAAPGPADEVDTTFPDERLRLIFTCCHPALSLESQVTLALRTLCGLSTAEIARIFLTSEATMAKRLVRTKHKIAAAGLPYRVPPAHLLPERTGAVLNTLYLMFHQGYVDGRGDLAGHARDLAATTAALLPDDPEVAGLHALLLLLDARRDARIVDGTLVPLEEQDRTRWDTAMIADGLRTVRQALRREQPGPYQLQALIAACHVQPQTDWGQIVRLYDELLKLLPSSTVRLNRAVAVAMRDGPQAGLDLLATAGDHPLLDAARADLLRRAGRRDEAAGHYRAAIAAAGSDAERRYLQRRSRR